MAVGFGEPPQSRFRVVVANISQALPSVLQFGRHTRTSKYGIGSSGRLYGCRILEDTNRERAANELF
jgi:hypothetical protein